MEGRRGRGITFWGFKYTFINFQMCAIYGIRYTRMYTVHVYVSTLTKRCSYSSLLREKLIRDMMNFFFKTVAYFGF
jgi:hypothetical protein